MLNEAICERLQAPRLARRQLSFGTCAVARHWRAVVGRPVQRHAAARCETSPCQRCLPWPRRRRARRPMRRAPTETAPEGSRADAGRRPRRPPSHPARRGSTAIVRLRRTQRWGASSKPQMLRSVSPRGCTTHGAAPRERSRFEACSAPQGRRAAKP